MGIQPGASNQANGSTRPVLSIHFDTGLRSRTELNVRGDLEDLLGVRLVFKRDLEPGGASYEYAPYPVPEYGLTDISVRLNEDWVSDGSGPAGLFCIVST